MLKAEQTAAASCPKAGALVPRAERGKILIRTGKGSNLPIIPPAMARYLQVLSLGSHPRHCWSLGIRPAKCWHGAGPWAAVYYPMGRAWRKIQLVTGLEKWRTDPGPGGPTDPNERSLHLPIRFRTTDTLGMQCQERFYLGEGTPRSKEQTASPLPQA